MNELPRGVYFEKKRNRYRVRIVRKKRKVHLSYHKEKEEAVETLNTWKMTEDPRLTPINRLINQTKLYYKQRRCKSKY